MDPVALKRVLAHTPELQYAVWKHYSDMLAARGDVVGVSFWLFASGRCVLRFRGKVCAYESLALARECSWLYGLNILDPWVQNATGDWELRDRNGIKTGFIREMGGDWQHWAGPNGMPKWASSLEEAQSMVISEMRRLLGVYPWIDHAQKR